VRARVGLGVAVARPLFILEVESDRRRHRVADRAHPERRLERSRRRSTLHRPFAGELDSGRPDARKALLPDRVQKRLQRLDRGRQVSAQGSGSREERVRRERRWRGRAAEQRRLAARAARPSPRDGNATEAACPRTREAALPAGARCRACTRRLPRSPAAARAARAHPDERRPRSRALQGSGWGNETGATWGVLPYFDWWPPVPVLSSVYRGSPQGREPVAPAARRGGHATEGVTATLPARSCHRPGAL